MKTKLFFSLIMFFIMTNTNANEFTEVVIEEETISFAAHSIESPEEASEELSRPNCCKTFYKNILDKDTKTHSCCYALNCTLCVATLTACGLNIISGGPFIPTALLSLGVGCEGIALWSLMASSKASFSEKLETVIAHQPIGQVVLFR